MCKDADHVPPTRRRLLWGDKDRVLDVSGAGVFKRYLPQAEVVVFKGVGHAPPIERTGEMAKVYEGFLGRG